MSSAAHDADVNDLRDKLTILITTSPIPSHPSTDCLDAVLGSLANHAPGVLEQCDVVLSADYYKLYDGEGCEVERERYKKGRITRDREMAYKVYLAAAERKLLQTCRPARTQHTYTHPHGRFPLNVYPYTLARSTLPSGLTRSLITHATHAGFAFSLRCALNHVRTPYVLVAQHDWAFCAGPVPLGAILAEMDVRDDMKYVTFISARSAGDYMQHANGMHAAFRNIASSHRVYCPQMGAHFDPLFHFLDRMHICRVDLYRDLIFCNPVLRRGNFVEDTFGQWFGAQIKERGVEAWQRIGTWTFAPEDGMPRIRHLQGRTTKRLQERQLGGAPRLIERDVGAFRGLRIPLLLEQESLVEDLDWALYLEEPGDVPITTLIEA